MTSMQALEDAEIRRNSAQSELTAARARVAAAQRHVPLSEASAPFDGVVERVDAAANAMLCQLAVQVGFKCEDGPRICGLYAEGRIASTTEQVLMLSEAARQRAGDTAVV